MNQINDYPCSECDNQFPEENLLVEHVKRRHQEDSITGAATVSTMAAPVCMVCMIPFNKMEFLNNHMLLKHEETPSMRMDRLEKASQTNTSNTTKGTNPSTDTNIKSMDCSECGLIFKTENEQNKHLVKEHLNKVETKYEKPRTCEYCEYKFNNSRAFNDHVRRDHTNICQHCNNSFTSKQDLVKHISEVHEEQFLQEQDTDNEADTSSDSEVEDTSSDKYERKTWGKDESNKRPASDQFKGTNKDFVNAVDKLKATFRKGSYHQNDDISVWIKDVEKKGAAIIATVEVTKKKEKGTVVLNYWGPNKAKEYTVQVNNKKGNDKKFVEIFSVQFVKTVIDCTLKQKFTNM